MACCALAACGLAGCGGTSAGALSQQLTPQPVQVYPQRGLSAAPLTYSLPRQPVVSFDVRLAAGSRLEVRLGTSRGSVFTLRAARSHVELAGRAGAVNGRPIPIRFGRGATLALGLVHGRGQVQALIISDARDRGALLLHRVAELHARLRPREFPLGAGPRDHLYIDSTGWTSGFWPGALWHAAALEPIGGMFASWGLQATIAHLGLERSDTHDVGFMYGQSSLLAWNAMCHGRDAHGSRALCRRLKRSVLSAANELVALARSNPGAGTIPTDSTLPYADTIIDSTMNISILPWATAVTGNRAYARLASHHAHVVASLLVRPNGSTAQSVHFDRPTGQVLLIHTHQGLSNSSTWSRGEAWAVYGFSQIAASLHDRGLLRVALRLAGYVQRHLGSVGIPRWDYDARRGPFDVSAGVITAAGLFHLVAACRSMPGVCGDPSVWFALGRRMLAASLRRASARPPLGLLSSQVLNEHAEGCWCNRGELSFGLSYGLEAERLAGRAG